MKTIVTLALLLPTLALAQSVGPVPPLIGYQGQLKSSSGTPVNGTVDMTFRIYAHLADTSALWTEAHAAASQTGVTTNASGFYALFLGAVTPFPANLFDGSERWLGVTVGTDPELTPRQRIASVAYALTATSAAQAVHAGSADSATSATNATNATSATNALNVVPGGSVNTGSVSTGTLTAGALQASGSSVRTSAPSFYVIAGGSCPPGDTPVAYRTSPLNCGDGVCGPACNTSYHAWSKSNAGQETCSAYYDAGGDTGCVWSTCTAPIYTLCSPP